MKWEDAKKLSGRCGEVEGLSFGKAEPDSGVDGDVRVSMHRRHMQYSEAVITSELAVAWAWLALQEAALARAVEEEDE